MHTELVSFHFLVQFLEINPKCRVPILLPYMCVYVYIVSIGSLLTILTLDIKQIH